MKTYAKYVLPLIGLLLLAPASIAQDDPPAADPQAYTQAELDQMLAPIALYSDSLLSQILMASTYPLEIVEAARWSRANPGFEGEAAVRMVEDRDWDPSVKSLVAFPRILAMMNEKLDWTQRLGNAHLALPEQVMDTVQSLRQTADAAGNLESNEHYRVDRNDGTVTIEPQNPEVVYVPYYNPLVVYGPWWWPAYPPVYWAPWPGYYAYPGYAGFRWSLGIFIGPRFFFGACDWPHRHITLVKTRPFYAHHVHHKRIRSHHVWKHDRRHRRGVAYRNSITGKKIARTHTRHSVHGKFSKHRVSRRGPHSASGHGARFKSRFEKRKRRSMHSRGRDSKPDVRRGHRRGDLDRPASITDSKRERRRMASSYAGVRGSETKTANNRRRLERKWGSRRGKGRGDHAAGIAKGSGFSARGRSPRGRSHGVNSVSRSQGSTKDFKSGSFKRGSFSARGQTRGTRNSSVSSFSSKKSFTPGSSGGSRGFGGFSHRNGGGRFNMRSR